MQKRKEVVLVSRVVHSAFTTLQMASFTCLYFSQADTFLISLKLNLDGQTMVTSTTIKCNIRKLISRLVSFTWNMHSFLLILIQWNRKRIGWSVFFSLQFQKVCKIRLTTTTRGSIQMVWWQNNERERRKRGNSVTF